MKAMDVTVTTGAASTVRVESVGDRIDLWHGKLSRRHAGFNKSIWVALKILKTVSGVQLTPDLALAIRREA